MYIKTKVQSLIFIGIFLSLPLGAFNQSALTVKYFGLTVHPFGDKTAHLQPYKLDDKARFVANFGAFVGYEKFIYKKYLSVKLIEAAFTDCSGGWASIHHLGLRFLLLDKKSKHRLYLGVGPTYILRNSWTRFGEEYNGSGYFNVRESKWLGTVQSKFILYGMEMEYDYALNTNNHLSISFTPGIPLACIFSVGWKRDFNKQSYSKYKFYVPE